MSALALLNRYLQEVTTCEEGVYGKLQHTCGWFLPSDTSATYLTLSRPQTDCDFNDIPSDAATCAPYNERYMDSEGLLVFPVLTGIFMCMTAFGIGANDAANSWATSVASGALPLVPATITAGIFEWAGAVLLGYGTSNKLQKGVSDLEDPTCWACGFCNSQISTYSAAMLGTQMATGIFLLLATFTSMPVSTTHAVIGAIVGATIAAVGGDCLNWDFDGGLSGIMASWVISPVGSAVLGIAMYILSRKLIIECPFASPKKAAIWGFPILISGITWYMTYLIVLKAPVTKDWEDHKMYTVASCLAAFMFAVGLFLSMGPLHRRMPSEAHKHGHEDAMKAQMDKALEQVGRAGKAVADTDIKLREEEGKEAPREDKSGVQRRPSIGFEEDPTRGVSALRRPSKVQYEETVRHASMMHDAQEGDATKSKDLEPEDILDLMDPEKKDAIFIFRYLLVFNAALESFSHGANDTANSTTAFSASIELYNDGLDACAAPEVTWWTLFIAGGFVALGVFVLGWKVIKTVGEGLTSINYHRGFCVEFASTVAVVVATILELPVSTTHCQVGAVVGIGCYAFGWRRVEWKLVGLIGLTWVITLPFSGLLSAVFLYIFRALM
jgi:sodium-dependent phosphate transporter